MNDSLRRAVVDVVCFSMTKTQPTNGAATMTRKALLAELLEKYNTARDEWIVKRGDAFNEADFHAWFTDQV